MKKRQKVLLGLMALGLVGGIGSAVALTRTAATQQSTSGGTDKAVYLYWGKDTNEPVVSTDVTDLKAKVAESRYVVVSPKVSTTLTGTVTVKFALSYEENFTLKGLTVTITETSTYKGTIAEGTTAKTLTPGDSAGEVSDTMTFSVGGEGNLNPTKYYTLDFVWDGTPVADDVTFGGSLAISQEFAE